tara:strand:- start:718 stop:2223 length:1506 start_codon:yes stop_codon:yes gene_type:complete
MNVSTEALKQSTLYASSIQGGNIDYDSFRYDLEKSYPNIFKDRHVRKEFTGLKNATLGGNSDSVEIAAFGLARKMYLKTTITFAAPANATIQSMNVASHLYKAFISRVALLNSSREIAQLHGDTLQWKAIAGNGDRGQKFKELLAGKHNLQLNSTKIEVAENLANEIVLGNGTAQSITFYTNLPWTFLEGKFQSDDGKKTSALSNYRFLETCRVLLEVAPRAEIVAGTTTTDITVPKIEKCELIVNYDIPESNDMMEIEKQYSLDVPLSVLVGNEVLTESSVTATATTTTHSVKVFNTNLAKGFLVCVHAQRSETNARALGALITSGASNGVDDLAVAPADTAKTKAITTHILNNAMCRYHSTGTNDVSRYGSDYKKINALTIKSSGRVLFEATTYEELLLMTTPHTNWLDVCHGNIYELSQTMDKNSCNDTNFYWIPFGEKENLNSFTGGLALKGLATCDIEVTFPSVDTVPYAVKVYTIHHNIISVDANSGRLIQSVSA